MNILWLLLAITEFFEPVVNTSVNVLVPKAGNCGDKTNLTCNSGNATLPAHAERNWYKDGNRIVRNEFDNSDREKYKVTYDKQNVSLTILDTDLNDEGSYRCSQGFDISNYVKLSIECKADSQLMNVIVKPSKHLLITIERVYPKITNMSVSITSEQENSSHINGSYYCKSSEKFRNYSRCEWSSRNSVEDGNYNCSIFVTTITDADPIVTKFYVGPNTSLSHLSPSNAPFILSNNISYKGNYADSANPSTRAQEIGSNKGITEGLQHWLFGGSAFLCLLLVSITICKEFRPKAISDKSKGDMDQINLHVNGNQNQMDSANVVSVYNHLSIDDRR